MTNREMGIEDARKKLGDLVTDAQRDGITTTITRNGTPAAVLAPYAATVAYTERLYTQPQEHTLYPRPSDRYECCECGAAGYWYPATAEVQAYRECIRGGRVNPGTGHIWCYPDSIATQGTGDRVFAAPSTPETTQETK